MTLEGWVTVLLGIAAVIAAVAALLGAQWRLPLAILCVLLLGVTVGMLFGGGRGDISSEIMGDATENPSPTESASPSERPSPDAATPTEDASFGESAPAETASPEETPSTEATRPDDPPPAETTISEDTAPADQIMVAAPLAMDGGLDATLYFGQLEAVLRELEGRVTFKTDPVYRSQHPEQCVATVVVTGAVGNEASVGAVGLRDGWAGAEIAPDPKVATDAGTLHQQLVIPPSGAVAGETWSGSALVTLDGIQYRSSDYLLTLVTKEGAFWQWEIEARHTIRCGET